MTGTETLETMLIKSDFMEALENMKRGDLEGKTETLGLYSFGDFPTEQAETSIRSLIQKFRNKYTKSVNEVFMTENGMKCDCEEWNSRRCCKHIVYVFDRLSIRNEHGVVIGIRCKVNEEPSEDMAQIMNFGSGNSEAEKWQAEHIAVIEL